MALRVSGPTTIFGVVLFVSKSLLGIKGPEKLEKFAILTRKEVVLCRKNKKRKKNKKIIKERIKKKPMLECFAEQRTPLFERVVDKNT